MHGYVCQLCVTRFADHMQAVARFGECQALLQRIDPDKSELCLSVDVQSKLQGVLASFACAAQCCMRGAAWLELLNVTRMWWNYARPIFNKVKPCLSCSCCYHVAPSDVAKQQRTCRLLSH